MHVWNGSTRRVSQNYLKGLAIGPNNSVVMCGTTDTTGPTVERYSESGTLLWKAQPPTLGGASDVGYGPDGRIYVAYIRDNEAVIVAFSSSGSLLSEKPFAFGTATTQVVGLGFDPVGGCVVLGGVFTSTDLPSSTAFITRFPLAEQP